MRAWTDYPIPECGDAPGKIAPIRLVNVLSYDGDKYCEIEGTTTLVKRGYLYKQRGRRGEVPCISDRQLKKLPEPSWRRREQALDALVALSEELGLYDLPPQENDRCQK